MLTAGRKVLCVNKTNELKVIKNALYNAETQKITVIAYIRDDQVISNIQKLYDDRSKCAN